MENPLLSITITNYNYGRFLPKNLDSILNQTFQDFEIIVVDDCSTDNSREILRDYAQRDSRIRLVEHESNQGLAESIIHASDLARGRYLAHMDGDDWIVDPKAFELEVAVLEKDPEIAFVAPPHCAFNEAELSLIHI